MFNIFVSRSLLVDVRGWTLRVALSAFVGGLVITFLTGQTRADVLYAVGDAGTIVKSIDGGATWAPQASGVTERLNAVDFVDATTGWTVGSQGSILHTTDGGATWVAQTSGTSERLLDVYALDGLHAYAVGEPGGLFLETHDGGANWNLSAIVDGWGVGINNNPQGVAFFDAQAGIAVGAGGKISTTSTAGSPWTDRSIIGTPNLFGVDVAGPSTVYAVGNGATILKSTNGGGTWTQQAVAGSFPPGQTPDLWDVAFVDADSGWAFGSFRAILRTVDGGTTWTIPLHLGSGDFTGGDAKSALEAWGVEYQTVWSTTDGGGTWNDVHVPLPSLVSVRDITYAVPEPATLWLLAFGSFACIPRRLTKDS